MIQILATQLLLPAAARWPQDNAQLALAAPAGLARSMNRSGLLLAECALALPKHALDLIRANGARTAMYCALEPSTLAQNEILRFLNDGTAAAYARNLPPKWGLQCSIGLAASSTTILLGIEGSVHSFSHPIHAGTHALNQALMDLHEGTIDFALVGAVNSLEDPLMEQRWLGDFPGLELSEAAAVILLTNGDAPAPKFSTAKPEGRFFGAAHPLVEFLKARA